MNQSIASHKLQKELAGIVLQARRLEADLKTLRGGSAMASVDVHFFVTACANATKWAEELKILKPEIAADLDAFICALREAKDLRNMLEHDNEYLKGKGHKQKDYLKDTKVNRGKLSITGIPPHCIVKSDEGICIGGRLPFLDAVRAALVLQEKMK